MFASGFFNLQDVHKILTADEREAVFGQPFANGGEFELVLVHFFPVI